MSLKDMIERSGENLSPEIAEKAGVDITKLAIYPLRIRFTVHQHKLEALAKLDSISHIEEVRPDEVLNDLARGTLNAEILALSTS
ncbi:hypothetical protein EDB82DRAFT_530914 [Fusarium venenatum]|uniref:uncharacterized protein n=1 Tax=Fusarium venenatum TaxID=56646 RepID=UPI001D251170|nr:hypothetical protein EDB82DRAFT_530914 [Fusarium venenatum]